MNFKKSLLTIRRDSFDDIITFEDFDSNNILLHKKSNENIWFMKIHEKL